MKKFWDILLVLIMAVLPGWGLRLLSVMDPKTGQYPKGEGTLQEGVQNERTKAV